MSVAAISADEAERLAVLRSYEILDTPPEAAFDRIVRLATALTGTPIAIVSFADHNRHWFKSVIGLAIREIYQDAPLDSQTGFDDDLLTIEAELEVGDAHDHPLFAGHRLASPPYNLRFFAGAPLYAPSGHRLGALWVIDRQARRLSPAVRTRLTDLAAMVVETLESRTTRRLLAASEARAQAELLNISTFIHAMMEEFEDPIFVKDIDGRYLLVNSAAARALGRPAKSIIGRTDFEILPLDIATALRATDMKVAALGQSLTLEEPIPASGGFKIYLSTKSPLLDTRGTLTGVLGIARDITARKQDELALREAKEEACRANQAKSEFLSAMSHELRTPLNAVLGFSQMLELGTREPLTPTQRTCVGHIHRAGQHLLNLVNEILDLAKIESGRVDLTLESVDIRHSLQESLVLVRPMAEARAIAIKVQEWPTPLPAVRADTVRLTQVLINLLSNAIKYNHQSGQVTITESLSAENWPRLTISDTGSGLSPEQMKRLFQPFDRLGAESRGIEGNGIGLVITQRLMELMGGRIGVISRLGEGCAFWIEFPQDESASPSTASSRNRDMMLPAIGIPADPTLVRAAPARSAGDRP
jgi:PAS domain S-box-containing protein